MITTSSTAASFVFCRNFDSARSRARIPKRITITSTMNMVTPVTASNRMVRRRPRTSPGGQPGISVFVISLSAILSSVLAIVARPIEAMVVQKREYSRHKNQSGHCCAEQPSDHSATERRVLFASDDRTYCHWDHANDHGEGRHQNRSKPREAGLCRGLQGIAVFKQPLLGEGDHKNTVRRRNPHAHDGAHQSGHAQGRVGKEQEDDNAGQSRRQSGDDDEWVQPGLKIDDDQQINENDGSGQTCQQSFIGSSHRYKLAAYAKETAARE